MQAHFFKILDHNIWLCSCLFKNNDKWFKKYIWHNFQNKNMNG